MSVMIGVRLNCLQADRLLDMGPAADSKVCCDGADVHLILGGQQIIFYRVYPFGSTVGGHGVS